MRKRTGPDDDAQISTHTVHTTVFTISLARGDRHEHGVDGRECSQLATTLLGKLQPGDVYYSRLESHVVVAEARSCVDLFPVQHIGVKVRILTIKRDINGSDSKTQVLET